MELIRESLEPLAHIVEWRPGDAGLLLRVASDGLYQGTILFKHGTPLAVARMEGLCGELAYRCERYGYQMWELRLKGEGPGLVELAIIPPPPALLPYAEEDWAEFRREFEGRPSRFPDSPAAFSAWQATYREKLWNWLTDGHPEPVPPETIWEQVEEGEAFRIERLTYCSRPDRVAKALLALPKLRQDKRAPLVLALHGHETIWGEAVLEAFRPGHADDFCYYLAARGFAVLQTPTMNHTLQDERWTLLGEWTWDALAGLDAVSVRREVDMARLGVVGLSTGGRLAQLVLALDDRVRAGVVAGIFTTRNHIRRRFRIPPHCDCGSSAYLDSYVEPCDLAALAAPRPVQIQHGRQDQVMFPGADPAKLQLEWNTGVMPPEEFEAAVREVERAYRVAGAPGRFAVHFHKGGHAVDNAAAAEWLSQALT